MRVVHDLVSANTEGADMTEPPAAPAATPAPATHEPTPADAAAIAQAAVPAVDPSTQTPEQARQAATAAMTATAADRNVKLDPADIDAIATATIAQLEKMGAFEHGATDPVTPPAPAPAPGTEPGTAPATTPAATAPGDVNPPRKLTFAEKFMGKS